MPRDVIPAELDTYTPPTLEQFLAATPAQRCIMGAELLEHEDKLPLAWNFEFIESSCGTAGCAIGSFRRQWFQGAPVERAMFRITAALDMSFTRAHAVFGTLAPTGTHAIGYGGRPASEVTPAMVADELRAHAERLEFCASLEAKMLMRFGISTREDITMPAPV